MDFSHQTDLFSIIIHLPEDEILAELWNILLIEFDVAFQIFVHRLFYSEQHSAAINNFKQYYDQYRENLENNINVLSKLATVFVDEPYYLFEYEDVCTDIEKYLKSNSNIF